MTECLHSDFSLSCIGERNGNPLQCSCLENLREGGAWWAAVYGAAQSQTRLKWLSRLSSSSITLYGRMDLLEFVWASSLDVLMSVCGQWKLASGWFLCPSDVASVVLPDVPDIPCLSYPFSTLFIPPSAFGSSKMGVMFRTKIKAFAVLIATE